LDALYGATSAMLECLIQSEQHSLALLPALPAAWTSGSVHGLGSRCGVRVDLRWQAGKAEATIRAQRACRFTLALGMPTDPFAAPLTLEAGAVHELSWTWSP
jgi:alpha-L-fucosidase 2